MSSVYTLQDTCENFYRIAFRTGICTSGRMYIVRFYKYCQRCLPKRILLTSSVRIPISSHQFCFCFNLCQSVREKYILLNCISWFFLGSSIFPLQVTFCPYCCLLFLIDALYIFWMIICSLKCMANIFSLSVIISLSGKSLVLAINWIIHFFNLFETPPLS